MKTEKYTMEELLDIMTVLRSPEGCPWDREQTHADIRKNMIEEAYEACEAIDLDDKELLCEELGDVLMQVVFHAEIEKEAGVFTFEDVVDGLCRKLIIRHPHVFGDKKLAVGSAEEVLDTWNAIKNETKNNKTGAETLDAVARSLPSLMRAEKLISRAERTGFTYPEAENNKTEAEIGDELFRICASAKRSGVDPEEALSRANDRFIERFRRAENLLGGFEGKTDEEILAVFNAEEISD